MKSNYSYWKVLRAQWSWKNDKIGLLGNSVLSVVVITYYFITGILPASTIVDYLVGFTGLIVILTLVYTIIYHILKLLILGPILVVVCYEAKNGNPKAESFYNEALTWRQ